MNNSDRNPSDPDPGHDPAARDDGPDNTAPKSDEEVWQDLVSRLEQTASEPGPTSDEPAGDETPRPHEEPSEDTGPLPVNQPEPKRSPRRQPAREDPGHLGGPRDYVAHEDEGFVPEEPPSLAGAEPLVVLAWIGAVGGPLVLLLTAFFWRSIPLIAVLAIIGVFLASVVFLLMRLPADRSGDNDDGAIV